MLSLQCLLQCHTSQVDGDARTVSLSLPAVPAAPCEDAASPFSGLASFPHVCTCIYIHMCVCVCMYMHVCVCIYIYLYLFCRFACRSCYYRHDQADDSHPFSDHWTVLKIVLGDILMLFFHLSANERLSVRNEPMQGHRGW